MRIVLNIYKYI